MFDVALGSYFKSPASEYKLSNTEEVLEASKGHKFRRLKART
jgi:hypothetical protein